MADEKTYVSNANLWDIVNTNIKKASAGKDRGIISKDGASYVMKENGVTAQSNSMYVQRISNSNTGGIVDYSLKHDINTVNMSLNTTNIQINHHRLNSQLYELTNMKNVKDTAIGNFTTMGTVLVKTYEPNLGKWVLIRRQVRVPVFSNLLDSYAIDERLDILSSQASAIDYKIDKEDGDD